MLTDTLIKRIITALILAPIIIALIFTANQWQFGGLLVLILLLAQWEWTRFILKADYIHYRRAVFVSMAVVFFLCIYLIYYIDHHANVSRMIEIIFFSLVAIIWLICLLYVVYYRGEAYVSLRNPVLMFFLGVILIVALWLGLSTLREMQNGRWWVMYILLIIWSADIGAYLTGKWWGKKKLAPKVSPGKTISGFWGGIVVSLIIASGFSPFLISGIDDFLLLLVLTLITVLFSILGDLFVSILKRHQGLKDTGAILPGHGGLLDRIDSALAAVPIFTLGILLLRLTS
ncbi:MAG: phosphatidate cytidylyltransferase [Pseudomonadota bacterium]